MDFLGVSLTKVALSFFCNLTCDSLIEVIGEYDIDVAEYLFNAKANLGGLLNLLCKDLSQACLGQLPCL